MFFMPEAFPASVRTNPPQRRLFYKSADLYCWRCWQHPSHMPTRRRTSDRNRLQDEVGRSSSSLDLYQSFADPKALTDKVYPFMLTGPVSPLSFTAAPVFLQVFNTLDELLTANQR